MLEIDMVGEVLSAKNWEEATPHVAIVAAGQSVIVLPEDFSLAKNETTRHGDNLMIRSLDGVVISIRGYFATSSPPKLVEYGGAENTALKEDLAKGLFAEESPEGIGPETRIVVGEEKDALTLSHPHENDSGSYSITPADDGADIITLDSE